MTRKPDRDWRTCKTALGCFKAGIEGSPFAGIGLTAMFVRYLFAASAAYRVGKSHDALLFDAARETVRTFRPYFERSEAFKRQSLTIVWDADAYAIVTRELAAEMANSDAVEEAVADRLQDERWALFTDTSVTHDDPRFYIEGRDIDNVVPASASIRDVQRFEYLKSEPLSHTFSRTLDLLESDGNPRVFYDARRQIMALARVGQAVFGSIY